MEEGGVKGKEVKGREIYDGVIRMEGCGSVESKLKEGVEEEEWRREVWGDV